jgi:hypothetical protein
MYNAYLQAFQYINAAGLLSPQDVTNFNTLKIRTIAEFNAFLSSLASGKTVQAVEIFQRVLSNPYLGMRLSGPNNPRGCKLVAYKPSNPQFANQGGVMASARTLKLAVSTIEKNICGSTNGVQNNTNTDYLMNAGGNPDNTSIYKSKVPPCNAGYYTKNGNPKTCSTFKNSLDYQNKMVSVLGITSAGPRPATNGISTDWSG